MTRRTEALAGIPARFTSDCPKCLKVIEPGMRVYFQRGEACHVDCSPGGEDR